jgi:hypothetical protein
LLGDRIRSGGRVAYLLGARAPSIGLGRVQRHLLRRPISTHHKASW